MNKKQRPVFLNLLKIKAPITAYESFTHRVTGVFLILFLPLVMYMFVISLQSEDSFQLATNYFENWFVRVIFWGGLTALSFHAISGVNHMLRDLGFGKELDSASKMSAVVILLTAISSVILTIYLFS